MPIEKSTSKEELREMHSAGAIRRRLEDEPKQSYLSDFIYGAIDGTVTTFAVVAGVVGAELETRVIIILGVANLIADGFSMAAANFLGSRAENQQYERTRSFEEKEIEIHPEGEREEIRQIFAQKGFEGETLERVVDVITSDRERWVDTMMAEEHGLSLSRRSAMKAATATFTAFVIVGAIPLLSFVSVALGVPLSAPFMMSIGLTGAAFFAIGAAKSHFVDQTWWRSGLETLAVGGAAAGLSYLFGMLLGDIAGV
jgi:VIT1/CCC1 family predicted Fe2+/Mn2+ transporter